MSLQRIPDAGAAANRAWEPLVVFDRVGKRFPDGTVALDDISLTVDSGEFVSLVGQSGCGKSTLLRIASSLDRCTSGTCTVGTDSLGYVFQEPTLIPWRTVEANVRVVAELNGLSGSETEPRVARALDLVGLSPAADQLPHQLSGGMKMRTSLARSLVMEPELFLFDEPFGALDEITRERLNAELLHLHAEMGFAALFVTHSIHEAVFLSNRVVLLSPRPGRIIGSFDVPFAYPRAESLRYEPEFARVCGEIAVALKDAS